MTSQWAGPLYGFKSLSPERVDLALLGPMLETWEPGMRDGDLRLRSGIAWPQGLTRRWPRPPGGLQAQCPIELQAIPHGVPGLGCSCGIYATLAPIQSPVEVPVLVRGWGRVALHTEGWRAEHARIEAVLFIEDMERLRAVVGPFGSLGRLHPISREAAEAYGVPLLHWSEASELVEPTRLYVESRAYTYSEDRRYRSMRTTLDGSSRVLATAVVFSRHPGAASPPDADPLQDAKPEGET